MKYDALLVRALASELSERLARRRIRAIRLQPSEWLAALELDREALLMALHPTKGQIVLGGVPGAETVIALPRKTTIARVEAPADERVLRIDLYGTPADQPRQIVVELMTNQWNVLVLDAAGRILSLLQRKQRGNRPLRTGERYVLPPAAARAGVETPVEMDQFVEILASTPPAERVRRLLATVAYTSPLNAGAILGRAAADDGTAPLAAAHRRYLRITAARAGPPCLLDGSIEPQPYPVPLPDVSYREFGSILEAMSAAAEAGGGAPAGAVGVPPELVDRLRGRIAAAEARAQRLAQERSGAEAEAEALRRAGDLLLAQVHLITKGQKSADLSDFEGGTLSIELNPALSPVENAHDYYDRAKRRGRAATRLPRLIERLRAEQVRLRELLDRAERGAATTEEVLAGAGEIEVRRAGEAETPLPYRSYRTSGGLEARVGRSGSANDDLTFRHSAPNDVWLHARDVAGAHVILRWGKADENPPARDLNEAAVLAALHSRARTSGVVAVDWTRRKHVRKPRKSAAGAVIPERVKTVFVEPDPAMEKRLRGDLDSD